MSYFIGNVLSPTETQPEQNDSTFAFTKKEAAELDLTNIPIRMEHHDNMEVGRVISAWNSQDGSKWIVGKLNNSGFQSAFAQNAIENTGSDIPYYTGLSLQHTHTQFASGDTDKQAVEISLCCNPRRSDCRIIYVSQTKSPKHLSRKRHYKTVHQASQMTDSVPTSVTSVAPAPTPVAPTPAAPVAAAPVAVDVVPSTGEMMEVIVKQQERVEFLQKKSDELDTLKLERAAEKEKELQKVRSKNEVFAKTLVKRWSNELSPEDLNDETRNNIMELATKFPTETADFFRVAHHASSKYAERETQQKEQLENSKNRALSETFNKVMSKQVHVASQPKQQEPKPDHFMTAMNAYRVKGSGRALMKEVVDLQQPKRRRMY